MAEITIVEIAKKCGVGVSTVSRALNNHSDINPETKKRILDMIKEKRLSVSAVATRAPVIIASGLVGGKATWKIEFPLIVSYESSQGVESTQHLMATVLVCRAPTVTTPRGVVIQQVVLKRES